MSLLNNSFILGALVVLVSTALIQGCSKQNLYHGAQSAQTAHCLKQPVSAYDDCMKSNTEDYQSYEKRREDLVN